MEKKTMAYAGWKDSLVFAVEVRMLWKDHGKKRCNLTGRLIHLLHHDGNLLQFLTDIFWETWWKGRQERLHLTVKRGKSFGFGHWIFQGGLKHVKTETYFSDFGVKSRKNEKDAREWPSQCINWKNKDIIGGNKRCFVWK